MSFSPSGMGELAKPHAGGILSWKPWLRTFFDAFVINFVSSHTESDAFERMWTDEDNPSLWNHNSLYNEVRRYAKASESSNCLSNCDWFHLPPSRISPSRWKHKVGRKMLNRKGFTFLHLSLSDESTPNESLKLSYNL